MKDGFRVVDADRHVKEPADLWDRYLEPAFRGRVTVSDGTRFVDGQASSVQDGRPPVTVKGVQPDKPSYEEVFADGAAHGFDAASNLRAMDRQGVDVAVHLPTQGLYLIWNDGLDTELAAAICRAYNNWLADFCAADRERLKGVAMIPLQDGRLAAAELRRAVRELGFVAAFVRPNPLRGRALGDDEYVPVYEAASELGAPLIIHEGLNTILPQLGRERLSFFGRHVACHPFEQMAACVALCADGLLERFPALKVGFMESGCGWLPYWLERLDEHWEQYYFGMSRSTSEPPSFYFKRQCVISCEAGEELVETVVEHVGDDYLVTATDYPHPDAVDKFPDRSIGDLTRSADLSDQSKRKILWDNPARLYNLPALVPA
jgi:predicted TIM-barrel fold metal-dependent hydrolase